MRPVSSRLMIAAAGLAALTLTGTDLLAAPGGGHAGGSRGGFGHGPSHIAGHARQGGFHGPRIRTVGRGYGAGDFGRASLGRGFGSGDDGRFKHRRFGGFGYEYGGFGFANGFGLADGRYGERPDCCLDAPAYPAVTGIRAAPVAPPAIYVVGESRRSGRGNLRRGTRGEPIEADSAWADGPSGVVSPGGARIIRVP